MLPTLRSFDFIGALQFISLRDLPLPAKLSLVDIRSSKIASHRDLDSFFQSFPSLEHLYLDYYSVPVKYRIMLHFNRCTVFWSLINDSDFLHFLGSSWLQEQEMYQGGFHMLWTVLNVSTYLAFVSMKQLIFCCSLLDKKLSEFTRYWNFEVFNWCLFCLFCVMVFFVLNYLLRIQLKIRVS